MKLGYLVKVVCTIGPHELWNYGPNGWAIYNTKTEVVSANGSLTVILNKWLTVSGNRRI